MQKKWIMGPALVAMLAGSMGISHAQPTAAGATATNPANRERGAGRGKAKRQAVLAPQMLVKVLGQPLTPEQKEAVDAAVKTYNESIAKAVGLTPKELTAKVRAYRQAQKQGKAAAPAAQ